MPLGHLGYGQSQATHTATRRIVMPGAAASSRVINCRSVAFSAESGMLLSQPDIEHRGPVGAAGSRFKKIAINYSAISLVLRRDALNA